MGGGEKGEEGLLDIRPPTFPFPSRAIEILFFTSDPGQRAPSSQSSIGCFHFPEQFPTGKEREREEEKEEDVMQRYVAFLSFYFVSFVVCRIRCAIMLPRCGCGKFVHLPHSLSLSASLCPLPTGPRKPIYLGFICDSDFASGARLDRVPRCLSSSLFVARIEAILDESINSLRFQTKSA